jgi:outer membrane protein assembly factor BamE (lipoprotein component of BamABCDE complex)
MKKIYFLSIIVAVAMSSCATFSTMTTQNQAPAATTAPKITIQAPRFTTIDKVLLLKTGMTYNEVVTILGSSPYDLHTLTYNDKHTVYVWYYKKIERSEDPNLIKTKEGAATGDEVIVKQQMLYVTFDANGKLLNAITDSGLGKPNIGDAANTHSPSDTNPAATPPATVAPKPLLKMW